MALCKISNCTVADGAALARNSMSAFWQDPTWVLSWQHYTLEEHIEVVTQRMPRNLLIDPAVRRHQKATDPGTGRILGYARWILPASHATLADGTPAWPEAMTPAVGPEEEAEFKRIAEAAPWNPRTDVDVLDEPIGPIKREILARKPYLRLDYLAVHPENQGKGVGTALVESGLRQAERMGLDVFVVAFKAGKGVYQRLGFKVVDQLIQDPSRFGVKEEYAIYFMIYELANKSSLQ